MNEYLCSPPAVGQENGKLYQDYIVLSVVENDEQQQLMQILESQGLLQSLRYVCLLIGQI